MESISESESGFAFRRTPSPPDKYDITLALQFDGEITGTDYLGAGGSGAILWDLNKDNQWIHVDSDCFFVDKSCTRNVATYMGLIRGVDKLLYNYLRHEIRPRKNDYITVYIEGASRLVLNQVQGDWVVKDPNLKRFKSSVHRFIGSITEYCERHDANLHIKYRKVQHKDNYGAYELAKRAIKDARLSPPAPLSSSSSRRLPPRRSDRMFSGAKRARSIDDLDRRRGLEDGEIPSFSRQKMRSER